LRSGRLYPQPRQPLNASILAFHPASYLGSSARMAP
jgi:hypothetical protein